MYAIVEIGGKQFKVTAQQKLYVPQMAAHAVGADVTFDRVLAMGGDGGLKTSDLSPISAKVLAHVKGDKVIVFKKKRRKGYRVKNGHRQPYTQIEIGAFGG